MQNERVVSASLETVENLCAAALPIRREIAVRPGWLACGFEVAPRPAIRECVVERQVVVRFTVLGTWCNPRSRYPSTDRRVVR
jgi:hypothetical protein